LVSPPDQHEPSAAPALQRGLAVLELVGQSPEPVGFSVLRRRLGLPKASAVRLLRCLRDGGYLSKDAVSGRYRLGPRAALLAGSATLSQRLTILGEPLLRELRDATSNSALLVRLAEGRVTCLAKAEAEAAIPMPSPGTVRLDLSRSPWGLIYFDAMDKTQQRRAVAHTRRPADLDALRQASRQRWPDRGLVYDDQLFVKHLRRIATPVHHHGGVVAALALGGNPLTLPDDEVDALGERLLASALQLQAQLEGEPRA
jgi:IclR family acetate operon transcriptional repressor